MDENDLRKQLEGLFSDLGDTLQPQASQKQPSQAEAKPKARTRARPPATATVGFPAGPVSQESEARIQALIDDLPVGYHEIDCEGCITRVNCTELGMLGYTAEEMLGRPAWEFAQDRETFHHAIHAQLAGEMPLRTVENVFIRKDGSLVPVMLQDRHLLDAQGRITGIRTILQNIAEQKQAEARLAVERNLLRTLIDALPDYIYAKDTQGKFVLANAAVARLMGANTFDDLIGKSDFDFYPHDLAEQYYASEQPIYQQGQAVNLEEPNMDAQGQPRWDATTKVPLRDDQGNIIGLVGISRDITQRKQMEAHLAQERNLMRTLIDALPDYIYVKDSQSRFLLTNIAQAKLLGATSPQDLLGKTDADFFSPALADKYVADEQTILHSGQPLIGIEEPTVDADGAAKWTLTTKVPVHNSQGEVTGLVGMGRDITGRKHTEALLDKRIRELGCLNDVSRKVDENPVIPEFMEWLAQRIPLAMQYPDVSIVGIEFEGAIYGNARAFELPTHIVGSLYSGGATAGRVCIAYTEQHDFLDEESALLGNLTRRVSAYVENRRLMVHTQAAYEEQLRFKLGIEQSTEAVFMTDIDGRIVYVNPTFEKMYGYTSQEAIGQTPRIIKSGVISQEGYRQFWNTLLAKGTISGEIVNKTKDGRLINIEGTNNPIVNEVGEIIGFLAIHSDVTGRKLAEAERERLLAEQRKRALQLQTAAEVSQAAASILDPNELLPKVVELVRERFNFYYVGVFMTDEAGQYAILRAATGEAGRKMLAVGHKLEIGGSSMIGQCVAMKQARIALDVDLGTTDEQVVRFDNPLLPLTRSEMALPLISRGRVMGAATVQSEQPSAFTQDDITILQTMADQVVTAIENARLFQESQRRVAELGTLNEIGRELSSAQSLEELYRVVYRQVGRVLDATNFYIASYEEGSDEWAMAFQIESDQVQERVTRKLGPGLTSHVIQTRKFLFLHNLEENRAFFKRTQLAGLGKQCRTWMGVPLIAAGKLVGVMAIQSYTHDNAYTDQDLELFSTVAAQAAVAIQNARLFEQARSRADELSTLNDIGRQLSSALSLEDLYCVVHQQVSRLFDTTSFFIGTYEAGSDHWQMAYRIEEGQSAELGPRSLKSGFGSHMIEMQKPLMINTAQELEDFIRAQNITRLGPSAKAWLGVPLIAAGQVVGVMAVQSYTQENIYTPRDLALFSMIGNQAAIAIQNARLFNETRERNTELATLNEIISSASQTLDLRALLDMVLGQTLQVFGFDGGLITIYNETRHKLERIVRTGLPGGIPDDPAEGLENSLCTYVFNSKQALVIEDFRHGAPIDVSGEIESGYYSYIGVPLEVKGRMLGTWCGFRKIAGPFSKNTPALLQTVGHQIGFAIENARLFEQTQSARQQAELRVREIETLNRFTREVSSTLDLNHVLNALVNTLDQDMDFSHISLDLIDEPANAVQTVRATGSASGMNGLVRPLDRLQNDITIDVARKRQIEIIDGWDDRFDRELFEREGHAKLIRAFVPLLLRDQALGVLEVGYQRGERAGILDEEIRLLRSLADRVAVAVENARLFEQTQARAQELVILNEMSRTLSAMLDREAVIKSAYQNTSRLMDTTNFYVALYDSQKDEVSFPFYAEGERIRALQGRRRTGKGLTEYVIRTREPLLIEENVSARLKELGIESIGQESQSWLGAPMSIGDQVVGVIAVQSYTTSRLYNKRHRDLLYAIASQTAVVLENTRLFEEARTRAEEMAALNELAQALASRLSVDQVLEQVYRGVSRLLDTTNFYISLYDPDKNEVTFPLNVTESVVDKQITVMPADQGLTGYIIRTRKPLLLKEDMAGHLEKIGIPQVGEPAESWLGVPMMIADQVLGVMAVQDYTTFHTYDEHDRDLLIAIGSQAAIAIQNARLFEQTRTALAELEATQRRYLHEQWETYLTSAMEHSIGFVESPAGLKPAGDVWLPEMEQAIQVDEPVTLSTADGDSKRSALAMSLKLRGEPIGVLEFYDEGTGRDWSDDERALVEALADQAVLALENARLFEDTQSRAQREQMINAITARIRASTDIETILRTTAEELTTTLNLSRARIRLNIGNGDSESGEAVL